MVSFISPIKRFIEFHRAVDPLNEFRLKNVLQFVYYFCLVYPLLIVWDLYDKFTPLKFILLIYLYPPLTQLHDKLYSLPDGRKKEEMSQREERVRAGSER